MPDDKPSVVDHVCQEGISLVTFRFQRLHSTEDMESISRELHALVEAAEVQAILLDCGVLDYMPSRLIGVFASVSHRLRAQGRRLALCRVRPEPLRTLRLMRLDALMAVYATSEEALSALRSEAAQGPSDQTARK